MKWIAELPSTNFRIFVSVCLAVIFVVTLLGGMVLGRTIQTEMGWMLAAFLCAMMGIDLAQFKFKRDSYQPAPPAQPDIEDAKAAKPPVEADPKED